MHRQPTQAQGFTLIEMLVAIAVIALLVGILIPSLSAAREYSKFVSCKANLRSIGQLLQSYAQENENRIPCGPTQPIAFPPPQYVLTSPFIGTNLLWMSEGYRDNADIDRPPQYIGLGLLTRKRGKVGNEFLFCPADDNQNLDQEASAIGTLQCGGGVRLPDIGEYTCVSNPKDAYGSYLYRQLDMLPPVISGEPQGRPGMCKLDELHSTGCNLLTDYTVSPPVSPGYNVVVEAMALDMNSLGEGDAQHTNHGGSKVNVVYRDGSVNGFDNELQRYTGADPPDTTPWASIPGSAFASANAVMIQLDRIFVAADYSYIAEEPWLAPVP